ncbi:acylglycerol kinase, mitochondrial [Sergentomyia squamirostris]
MAFVIKFAKNVRNHWKKSVFAAALLTYGASYAGDKIRINNLMRDYCLEASKYGQVTMPVTDPPREILVLLNPAANKRSAEETFKKYCEPILHLGGFLVNIVKTDSEGHARRYVEELTTFPSAILVAGGDGTLSEVVTGVLRKNYSNHNCPIGMLPLGRMNSSSDEDFPLKKANRVEEARQLGEAAISVLRGNVRRKHVMKIEVVSEAEEEQRRPVYAVGSFQWGAFRDILSRRDQYWYTGSLREYTAFLINSFSSRPTWDCAGSIKYTPPCAGCRNCVRVEKKTPSKDKWWSGFTPKTTTSSSSVQSKDFSGIENEMCSQEFLLTDKHSEVIVATSRAKPYGCLQMKLADPEDSSFSFILNSWRRLHDNTSLHRDPIEARTVEIHPDSSVFTNKEKYYALDNEEYDVKPIKITLIPHAINMFSSGKM